MKLTLFFAFFIIVGSSWCQLERGKLAFDNHPDEVLRLIDNSSIHIDNLRQITNFLTNRNISQIDGFPIPKRKKAFLRHIKHLSEQLEQVYFDKQSVTDEEIETLYELVFFYHSLIKSAKDPSGGQPNFKEKIRMWRAFHKSKRQFRFAVTDSKSYLENPNNSPYWQHVKTQRDMLDRFDALARRKRIRPRKNLVVVFKKLSYSGSAPKIRTLDLDYDNEWSLKWGDEVHTDVVGSRIFAALGYDVDHPYYYGKDSLTLVFDLGKNILNIDQLCDSLSEIYQFNLRPFISQFGVIDSTMIKKNKRLRPYLNRSYATFIKCAVEGRPDRVKRIGSFLPNDFNNASRRELRGCLLVHAWIDNWDTREANTLFTTVHDGSYNYLISGVFSDLGTSLGVKVKNIPPDFKVGLVNELNWEVAQIKGKHVNLNYRCNEILQPFKEATYDDLKWMAMQIAKINAHMLREIIKRAGWPQPVGELYFHKLASRRSSILHAFDVKDPNPIDFEKNLTIYDQNIPVIVNGKLINDWGRDKHPESFYSTKGRLRNYGNN